MKVLFVSEYWEPHGQGGGEISAAMLAKALAKHGVDVHVLTGGVAGVLGYERRDGLVIHRKLATAASPTGLWNNLKRTVSFPRRVRREVKNLLDHERFDLIHYFNTTSALGAPKVDVPQLVHVNSPVFFCPKGTLMYQDKKECHYTCTPTRFLRCFVKSHEFGKTHNAWYYKWNPVIWLLLYTAWRKRLHVLKTFGHVTPNSPFMDEKLHDVGVPDERITIVPNVVLIGRQSAAGSRQIVSSRRKTGAAPRILYAGTFIESKGVLDLLNALKDITLPYTCDILGDGPLKQTMLDLVAKNHLTNVHVHNPIPHDELLERLQTYDIIVQPSLVAEAMPRTVLEALAAGRVVVTSNVGGAKGVIRHGENGILYDPYAPGALKNVLETVLADPVIRKKLSAQAPDAVKSTTEKAVANDVIKLYERLLAATNPSRT
jgi:glycosyltransferase involved in cell wall biosynthesis